uniref:peptidylprolyl isomerase n=1 Tax=Henneguya salminicola TaxID=69463 RepID=A0A6G3ML34_HENSL
MPSSLVYSKSACFNQLSIEVLKPPCIGSEKSKKGDTLTIHHTKTLIDGTVVYSSYELGRVLDFKIGKGNQIKGMEQGLLGMGVGEIRKLEIPSALGYGPKGVAHIIPPNQDLIYQVELLKINGRTK